MSTIAECLMVAQLRIWGLTLGLLRRLMSTDNSVLR